MIQQCSICGERLGPREVCAHLARGLLYGSVCLRLSARPPVNQWWSMAPGGLHRSCIHQIVYKPVADTNYIEQRLLMTFYLADEPVQFTGGVSIRYVADLHQLLYLQST